MSPAGPKLTDEERLDWLRLIRSERIGPRTFRALLSQFGSARAAIGALPDLARRAGRERLRVTSRDEAEREIEKLGRLGGRLVAQGEAAYPRALLAIDTAPPLIAVRGSEEALGRPIVAIVGSRNASAAGGVFTERLAAGLGEAGYVVASGLARGIDTRAHRAALATGTVAVMAGGHDRVYPDENAPLLDRIIAEGGAAVSEMPLGWEPRGRDFPRRNRIVSGLSYGVVVVEAARRSGSLITARCALEQGREVFAVPGSPLDPRAEGANDLIRGGATLCASAEDVISALAPLTESGGPDASGRHRNDDLGRDLFRERPGDPWDEFAREGSSADADEGEPDESSLDERSRVIASLGVSPVGIDELSRQAGVPVRTVQLVLLELDLAGRLARHGGAAVSLLPSAAAG